MIESDYNKLLTATLENFGLLILEQCSRGQLKNLKEGASKYGIKLYDFVDFLERKGLYITIFEAEDYNEYYNQRYLSITNINNIHKNIWGNLA